MRSAPLCITRHAYGTQEVENATRERSACSRTEQSRQKSQLQTEDQIALQLGIDESSIEPEPGTQSTVIRTELSNAADFTEAENIRNKVVKEDGDIPHEWDYPCQNLEDDVQDAAPVLCRACDRDIRNLNQIQCRRCTFRFCGMCVWFCAECLWTTCRGGNCACNCQFSDNYDSEQDTLRELRDIQELRSPIPEENESEGEPEAEAEAKAEAAADGLK